MSRRPVDELRLLVVGLRWPLETFLAQLFQRLATRGIHVTLVTINQPRQMRGSLVNVDVWHLPGWDHKPGRRLGRVGWRFGGAAVRSVTEMRHMVAAARSANDKARFLIQLHRWLPYAGRDWDVCYIPWNSRAVDYLPLMELRPTVISCRGSQINIAPHNPLRASLRDGLATTFDKAAAVHCVSRAIRDEALKYGLDEARSVIIRPAVDPELFHPLPAAERSSDGRLRLISTGSLNWKKGHVYALSAVRHLVDRGLPICYEIIGDGPDMQRLVFTIQDLELDDHVIWHGKLSPPEVRTRLQAADVFLLPSLSEGISNAALEAMACGLPVVTTDVGGMSEAVTDGVEGFLIPPLDTVAAAGAIEELSRSAELRERMGAAGRARVLRDFHLDDQADAFADLFRSVA